MSARIKTILLCTMAAAVVALLLTVPRQTNTVEAGQQDGELAAGEGSEHDRLAEIIDDRLKGDKDLHFEIPLGKLLLNKYRVHPKVYAIHR